MKKRIIYSCLVAVSFALSSNIAIAQSNFSKDDIVSFFVESADLGTTRGICIGTAEECAPVEEPAGFDMLINFEHDSADLTPEARNTLDIFVLALGDERLAAANFLVEGHTDAKGGGTYNQSLSERRATSVVSFLEEKGVERGRLFAVGLGESKPRVDDENASENRRVEMRLLVR